MPKGHEKEASKTSIGIKEVSIKDTKDISNILTILDGSVIRTSPFGANVTGENSYKRAERIVAALHLITNHVPADEPLRTSIREGGLRLLELLLELRIGFRSPASEKSQETLARIRELVSYVRMLAIAGYVSAQNGQVVADALDELGSLIISSQKSSLAEQMTISHDDLMPPAAAESLTSRSQENRHRANKRTVSFEKDNNIKRTYSVDERASRVLDMLKAGGTLGIKDISVNLPQYSEKMIQRELAELVLDRKVEKLGAKRWSRYRVVQ